MYLYNLMGGEFRNSICALEGEIASVKRIETVEVSYKTSHIFDSILCNHRLILIMDSFNRYMGEIKSIK